MSAPPAIGGVPPEEVRALSGLEFLSAIAAGRLPSPPVGATLDFRLVEVAPGCAVFEGRPRSTFYKPLGYVHGGWAMTLGQVISVGRRIGTAEARLLGADGRVYAHGTSTCLIFPL